MGLERRQQIRLRAKEVAIDVGCAALGIAAILVNIRYLQSLQEQPIYNAGDHFAAATGLALGLSVVIGRYVFRTSPPSEPDY